MASSWGDSWGTSWGDSWGIAVAPEPSVPPRGYLGDEPVSRKRKKPLKQAPLKERKGDDAEAIALAVLLLWD